MQNTQESQTDVAPLNGSNVARRRFSVPLKATIIVVFFLTTVPVLLATIQINYQSSERVLRNHAADIVERFRNETIRQINSEFQALKSLVATAAELGRQAPDLFTDSRALVYLFEMLGYSETLLNIYVGTNDGGFRQARRIHDHDASFHGAKPPEDAVYAYRLIEPDMGPPILDRYIFLDNEQSVLGDVGIDSGYDPRSRSWYLQAEEAGDAIITDPELFWAFGLVGFTVAEPYSIDGSLLGVVAADVTLDRFSQYLAENPVSDNSVSYMLDDKGLVLAASDGMTQFGGGNNQVALTHVADAENRIAATAYSQSHESEGAEVYDFSYDGQDFIVSLSSFHENLGKPWRLMVVTPLDDFTAEFHASNRKMLIIGLAAVAIQLTVITIIAGLVASPLQRLARKVERIQSLDSASDISIVRSRVREIAILSSAIETLDTAVQAFARFVPVELVRQLLKSDQKLELGGQSRFLSILFCDVEAFSTLAERIAARDLLSRVSSLLGMFNRRVLEEKGTIDKFVGDGVMAFWGAPSPLDEHAFHACVAALAVQNDLERLNQDWRKSDEPEMRLRVGIHSDVVLVGNVGSRERMSYTVLGDGVNIAARLEDCNKIYGTQICISHDTFREAGDRLCVRPIDELQVKGRRSLVTIYELLGAHGAGDQFEPSESTLEIARLSRRAFDALVAKDHNTALKAYREVLERRPDDPVASLHVKRLEAGEIDPPSRAWVREINDV
ncbi:MULTISPECIES: adenylate/guanylate cyclase domain-containing protein [unclassified Ruegeria]|uniref:adenylate/guanylate cyclase domain-containing protein n=1 Tax=unclassified Ruegeria TaxID=2625375 RepID=UPI0014876193|nr:MULTISPECIES: adenylate/guanylate cyclase domain-containing protein [unclassified Ruegeria]